MHCIPAHTACPLLPGIVMAAARLPIPLIHTNTYAPKAVSALVGWCTEGWLLADSRQLQDATSALACALLNYCKSWSWCLAIIPAIIPS
jgi:hypothetical protein